MRDDFDRFLEAANECRGEGLFCFACGFYHKSIRSLLKSFLAKRGVFVSWFFSLKILVLFCERAEKRFGVIVEYCRVLDWYYPSYGFFSCGKLDSEDATLAAMLSYVVREFVLSLEEFE